MPGARMSDDRVARSLMSSLSWLVAPSFQVSTSRWWNSCDAARGIELQGVDELVLENRTFNSRKPSCTLYWPANWRNFPIPTRRTRRVAAVALIALLFQAVFKGRSPWRFFPPRDPKAACPRSTPRTPTGSSDRAPGPRPTIETAGRDIVERSLGNRAVTEQVQRLAAGGQTAG